MGGRLRLARSSTSVSADRSIAAPSKMLSPLRMATRRQQLGVDHAARLLDQRRRHDHDVGLTQQRLDRPVGHAQGLLLQWVPAGTADPRTRVDADAKDRRPLRHDVVRGETAHELRRTGDPQLALDRPPRDRHGRHDQTASHTQPRRFLGHHEAAVLQHNPDVARGPAGSATMRTREDASAPTAVGAVGGCRQPSRTRHGASHRGREFLAASPRWGPRRLQVDAVDQHRARSRPGHPFAGADGRFDGGVDRQLGPVPGGVDRGGDRRDHHHHQSHTEASPAAPRSLAALPVAHAPNVASDDRVGVGSRACKLAWAVPDRWLPPIWPQHRALGPHR